MYKILPEAPVCSVSYIHVSRVPTVLSPYGIYTPYYVINRRPTQLFVEATLSCPLSLVLCTCPTTSNVILLRLPPGKPPSLSQLQFQSLVEQASSNNAGSCMLMATRFPLTVPTLLDVEHLGLHPICSQLEGSLPTRRPHQCVLSEPDYVCSPSPLRH